MGLAALTAAALTLATQAHAQRGATVFMTPAAIAFDKVEIKTTDLGRGTYLLEGFAGNARVGSNVTVAVGTEGVLLVDGQFAKLSEKVKAAIKAISPLPIKYLVNTHFHGDHTGGNAGFGKDGVTIVAHDNLRLRLSAETVSGLTGLKVPPVPPEGVPRQIYYGGSLTLDVGGRKAQLTHVANAHTDGDTWVYLADADVLCTGDTFNNLKRYQAIDFMNGGDVRGMVRALDAYIKVSTDKTRIVPGHGPLATGADLEAFRAMLVTSRDRIQKLVEEGKTAQEVVAMAPLADLDATWANSPQHAAYHTNNVYNSFLRH
jgi:glyoxylase-like metal-dependent hydrolase (beta-lactamase superfamily II)